MAQQLGYYGDNIHAKRFFDEHNGTFQVKNKNLILNTPIDASHANFTYSFMNTLIKVFEGCQNSSNTSSVELFVKNFPSDLMADFGRLVMFNKDICNSNSKIEFHFNLTDISVEKFNEIVTGFNFMIGYGDEVQDLDANTKYYKNSTEGYPTILLYLYKF